MKRFCLVFLCIILITAIFNSCVKAENPITPSPTAIPTTAAPATATPSETDSSDAQLTLPLSNSTVEFTAWSQGPWPQIGVQDYDELEAYQEMEKRTNVHMNWILPSRADTATSLNLTVASGDLPDTFMVYTNLITAGLDNFIDENIFTDVTDLVKQYCPNYTAVLDTDNIRRGILTDSGRLAGFFSIKKTLQPTFMGPVVREDFLDTAGIDVNSIKTLDDYETVLDALKNKIGCEMPCTIMGTIIPAMFLNAWDIGTDFYQVDGKVMYGPLQDEYLKCLTMLNGWWNKGYIDSDFYVSGNTFRHMDTSLTLTGKLGLWQTGYNELNSNMELAKASGDTTYKLKALPMPVINEGDIRHVGAIDVDRYQGNFGSISPACKNPEILAKWYDYLFSEEGSILHSYGTGTAFYYDDNGKPKCNELIYKNPDGLMAFFAMCKYSMSLDTPALYDWERELLPILNPRALEALDIWDANFKPTRMIPRMLAITSEESAKYTAIMGDVDTYISEMYVKFVIGQEPLSGFDAFRQNLLNLGVKDAIAIKQAALDRFYARS